MFYFDFNLFQKTKYFLQSLTIIDFYWGYITLYNPCFPNILYSFANKLKLNKMSLQVLTKEDLDVFKTELFSQLKGLINDSAQNSKNKDEVNNKWLKSHQVQRMLAISPGTLQNLRINGTIPFTKIGGVIFYSVEDINAILQRNKRNTLFDGKG